MLSGKAAFVSSISVSVTRVPQDKPKPDDWSETDHQTPVMWVLVIPHLTTDQQVIAQRGRL
jgi:hypothetical protein